MSITGHKKESTFLKYIRVVGVNLNPFTQSLTSTVCDEIFAGEAGQKAAAAGGAVASAFSTMRLIVLVGWSIYPLGYVLGYMTGTVDPASLNGIYNIADFVNKIAFGLMIWAAATSEEA